MGLFDWLRAETDDERQHREVRARHRQRLEEYRRQEGDRPIPCRIMAGDLGDAGPGREHFCRLFRQAGVLAYATGDAANLDKGECEFFDFAKEVLRVDVAGVPTPTGEAVDLGVAGLVVAGPVGAAAGALLGGSSQHVYLAITFKDGRRILLQALTSDLGKIQAMAFK